LAGKKELKESRKQITEKENNPKIKKKTNKIKNIKKSNIVKEKNNEDKKQQKKKIKVIQEEKQGLLVHNYKFENIEIYLQEESKFNDEIINAYLSGVLSKKYPQYYFANTHFSLDSKNSKKLITKVC
jgi:hypothetical protein